MPGAPHYCYIYKKPLHNCCYIYKKPPHQEWNSNFGLDKDRKKDSWQGF